MNHREWEDRQRRTAEAFANPQVGDRFSEMLSYWLYVVAREGNRVTTLEASPPCIFPADARVWQGTVEEFRARFQSSAGGYSILLEDRGRDVAGWAEGGREP